MKRTLITIEGTDGSGKATQTALLAESLRQKGLPVRKLSFPNYGSDSSALVKMYLAGAFGAHPDDVNPFAASTFYAVDRYASYKTDWEKAYLDGEIILTDRYTISNAIHQGAKLPDIERKAYLDWLFDFEYSRLGIPKPTLVIYLDVPSSLSAKLRARREAERHTHADIHEADNEYLSRCRNHALALANEENWKVVRCAASESKMRTVDDIHKEIEAIVFSEIKQN